MSNALTVIGRLGRDPELGETPSGRPCCKFSVAEDLPKDTDGNAVTQWYNCYAYDRAAEMVAKYFTKGRPIFFTGTQKARAYTNKNGEAAVSLDVQLSRWDFVPFGEKREGNDNHTPEPSDPTPPDERKPPAASANADDNWDGPPDDIPDPFVNQ